MERTYQIKADEEMVNCPQCGNQEFIEDVFCLGHERVNLVRGKNGIGIISISVDKVSADDIEYSNFYVCSKCGFGTTIVITDGKEHLSQ